MDERMFINTGVRLKATQWAKLNDLAQTLNTSRNRVFGLLLDAAEVQAPSTTVQLKNSRSSGQNTAATQATVR